MSTATNTDYTDSDEEEGVSPSSTVMSIHTRTPIQLRRLVKRIRAPRTEANYILILFQARQIVERYAGSSPLWLKRELTNSLLQEVDELDNFSQIHADSIAHLQNIIDSGATETIRTQRCGCCCIL